MLSELSRLVINEIKPLQELSTDQLLEINSQMVQSKLVVYQEIYEAYNTGLALIKEKQYFEAEPIFTMLISQEDSFPLPNQVYKGHFLTLLGLNKLNEFYHQFNLAPLHVQNSKEFRELELKVKQSIDNDHKPIFNMKLTHLVAIVASVLLVISGAFLGNWYSERNEIDKSTAKVIVESSDKSNVLENQKKEAELKQEAEKQAKKIKELEDKALSYEEEINKYNETNAILAAANIKMPDVINDASQELYSQGIKDYEDGNFERAKDSLKKILAINKNQYYSDDAHFFLIHTYLKTNNTDEAYKYAEKFLESTDQAYVESPYQGEIMLIKANYLISQGNKKEAEVLLSKIIEKYPNEWTAERAQSMLD